MSPTDTSADSAKSAITKIGDNLSVDEMLDFMKDDETPKTDSKSKDTKNTENLLSDTSTKSETSSDEKDETDEEELKVVDTEDEEDEEPIDEDLNLRTPVRRKEILAKYPKLFEDFPYLETAYYKEQKYTELLPTIDDAKEAVEKSQALDKYETDLYKGSPESILKSVRDSDADTFGKIVDNYLPALRNVDERAFNSVVGSVIKSTIMSMVQEARSSSNDDLQAAAVILNQFIYGTSQFQPHQRFGKAETESSEKQEIQNERNQILEEKFNDAREELDSRTTNAINSTLSINIDPKEQMTPYVKKTAIKEARENLDKALASDPRFRTLMNRLWEKAQKERFSINSKNAIKAAYLSKSKTLLPQIIQKARIEALKGMGKRVSSDERDRSGRMSIGRNSESSQKSNSQKESNGPKPGESDLEFLSRD